MPGILYPNRHTLDRQTRPTQVPCWRIGHLIELRGRLSDPDYMREVHDTTPEEALATWETTKTSDYPNGLHHDSSCTTCNGSGLMKEYVTAGYSCMGCGMEGPLAMFDESSCLGIGAGFYEELRARHEMGDHDETGTVAVGEGPPRAWRLDHRRCPLCIERKLREAAHA